MTLQDRFSSHINHKAGFKALGTVVQKANVALSHVLDIFKQNLREIVDYFCSEFPRTTNSECSDIVSEYPRDGRTLHSHRLKMVKLKQNQPSFTQDGLTFVGGSCMEIITVKLRSIDLIKNVIVKLLRWPGHVARMERRGTRIDYWWESQRERDH
jgi:hypothetical protein